MDEALKPCPFCGGEADYHSEKGPTGEVYGWVGCNQCDAMSCHTDTRSMQPEETHPIDAWNTRADAAPTPNTDEVKAVADIIYPAIDGPREAAVALSQAAIAALDAARGKAEPVAWMYIRKPEEWPPANPVVGLNKWKYDDPARPYWTETPLYAHPPAPDAARGDPVARVVEFIREQQANADKHMREAADRKTESHFAAAFVTLRNLADAIERGVRPKTADQEPFRAQHTRANTIATAIRNLKGPSNA